MGWKRLVCLVLALAVVTGGCKRKQSVTGQGRHGPSGQPTDLSAAAHKGDIEAVRSLIAQGANVNQKRQYADAPPLHEAAANGYYDIANLLLQKGADVNAEGMWGQTPLHAAAARGHKDLVELLLTHGADINAGRGLRLTPLHLAACAGQIDMVSLLVAHGADVNAAGNADPGEGETPLLEAAREGHRDVADFLLAHGAEVKTPQRRDELLCFAAKRGWTDVASRLIAQGKTTDGYDRKALAGALWQAITEGHADTVKLLIASGADTEVKDERGDTALHIAAFGGDNELAKLLLERDTEVDARNGAGDTPLHLAARQGDRLTVQLLVAHYAELNAKNWAGLTPLHYAASQRHREIILLLLANGASVNAQDKHGNTPLHAAAVRGHAEAIEVLARHGADLQARDNDGLTAKDRAARRRQTNVIALLTANPGAPGGTGPKIAETRATASEQASAKPKEAAQTPGNDPDLEALRVPHAQLSESAQARRSGKDLVRGNSAFAVDLYRQLSAKEGNLFFSPYSISTALAMTFAAARENTEKEMAKVLHFSLEQKDLHPAFTQLQRSLDKVQKAGNVKLYVANSLWPQRGKPFLNEYLSLAEKHYGVSITAVDYETESSRAAARKTINTWVEENTQDKIKDLLQPEHLTGSTRLVLTNAIYFKGDWEHQFEVKDTEDAPFYVTSADSVTTPMMKQTEEVRYAEVKDLQILELRYRGGELSMLVLLPRTRDGLRRLERELSVEDIELWRQRLVQQKVVVFLPKFKVTVAAELKKTLRSMGMVDAFQWPGANFAGFDGDPRWWFIGQVVHKAYVDVNEEGTEAAAATAVIMGMGGMGPPQPPVFRADHPFLFLIQENSTGSILFLGRVVDPTQAGP
jgi:serine protease inhibitor/ankyrin repeat protein